jgi:uncharacterized protein YigE (DUF2233 family)
MYHLLMKKVFLMVSFLGMLVSILIGYRDAHDVSDQTPSIAQITPHPSVSRIVGSYAYDLLPLSGKRVSLHPNFSDRLTSNALREKHQCMWGTNGGFYDTSHRPIGLFVSEGVIYREAMTHDLFIGYVYERGGVISIDRMPPAGDVVWALQSGPLVWDDGETRLKLRVDESARRMLIGQDVAGQTYLLVLYREESVFMGPRLEEVGRLIRLIGARENISFTKVLNLDGGMHSFYLSSSISFHSFLTPGSILCVKESSKLKVLN